MMSLRERGLKQSSVNMLSLVFFDDTALNDGEEDVNKHFLFDERVGGGGRGLVARAIYDPSAIRHSPESHEHTLSPHVLSFKIDLLWSYASKVCVVCNLPLSYQANTHIWQMLQCSEKSLLWRGGIPSEEMPRTEIWTSIWS